MSQYFTDFSEYPEGDIPGDWSERWVLGGQHLTVVAAPHATGGALMAHRISEDSRRAWAWDAVPPATDVEVLTRVSATDPASRFGVIARGEGRGSKRGGEVGWTCELDHQGSRFRICSYDPSQTPRPTRPHGIGRILGEDEVQWAANEWFWMRMRLESNGGWVRALSRLWRDGHDEPSDWQHRIDRSDPSHLGRRGWVGITGQTTHGVRHFDVFGVGTDGDPAP